MFFLWGNQCSFCHPNPFSPKIHECIANGCDRDHLIGLQAELIWQCMCITERPFSLICEFFNICLSVRLSLFICFFCFCFFVFVFWLLLFVCFGMKMLQYCNIFIHFLADKHNAMFVRFHRFCATVSRICKWRFLGFLCNSVMRRALGIRVQKMAAVRMKWYDFFSFYVVFDPWWTKNSS